MTSIVNATQQEREFINILDKMKNKFYRASKGTMKYLICKETGKKVVLAPTNEEFMRNVISFFR